jgi:carbon-monoxide dehydrogenase small subunit
MSAFARVGLNVNGQVHRVEVEPRKTLADTIRENCGLTGTHLGCEHGVCGACTILLDGEPVRSCLMFAVQAEGRNIRTVEGLQDGDRLHVVQQAFVAEHALQCGFCTPGFLMLIVGTLETYPDIDEARLREFLSANLCRCTGYENIVKAALHAAAAMRAAP